MLSLKGCLSAPDQLRFLPQRRSLTGSNSLARRGTANVSCCSSSLTFQPLRTSDIIISNGSVGAALNKPTNGAASSVEQLQLGSGLAEDGRSYKEKFTVRCYEVGMNKTATIDAIANLMQMESIIELIVERVYLFGSAHTRIILEAACNHIQSFTNSRGGMGTTNTMRKLNLIWVTTRNHIEVYKYPTWGSMIEIETWFEVEKVGSRRDFIIKDATGTLIGRATSKWVSINKNTRRLHKVPDEVLDEIVDFSPQTPRLAFPEEDTSSLKKIPKLEDPAQYSQLGLKAKRADLDMNLHVNNVTYIGWFFESMPQEIMDTYELQKVTLDYRRECQCGDVVDSLTSMELMEDAEAIPELNGTNGSAIERKHKEDYCRFLHFLRFQGGGLEINRGRTEWKRKSTK